MKFKEILNRLTGISTPVFGVSWNPSELEIEVAKRVINTLEDRRVLYNPSELEAPRHCINSVLEIRQFLTIELNGLAADSKLSESLRAMRASCRKFLDSTYEDETILKFGDYLGHYASWKFSSAVGELRGVFGVHIAKIATQYGLDVEDSLAVILPASDDGAI